MVAPVSSPTVVPRSPVFPRLLPLPPHPHPIPPAPSFQRRERFINYRDIWREMDELSDERARLRPRYNAEIKNRGYNFLIPIGRTWTQHEEKNDDRTGSDRTGDANSLMDEDENDSSEEEEEDLDADMEDMDQTANNTADLDAEETGSSEESSEEEDSDD
ncbi:hypothetical protein C8T65DRAFT_704576 [Cerioporus squamosus]|nr:hypothetical protein C8T65DRAFT_704576 [Cerioporus squamosus]